jgi:general stress protein YciG
MGSDRRGGLKAAKTNYARYGEDFYKRIGKIGGLTPKTRPSGFKANPELARLAGIKGGAASRRGPAKRRTKA